MPDQVRCTGDSSHAFTCEVFIGPDPDPIPATAAPPVPSTAQSKVGVQPAPSAQSAAVSTLVRGYKQVDLPAPDVPYVTGNSLLACGGNELAILLASAAKGALAPLVALKAGYDTGKCLAGERNAASAAAAQQEAADDCAARGGTVTAVVENRSVCEVQVDR